MENVIADLSFLTAAWYTDALASVVFESWTSNKHAARYADQELLICIPAPGLFFGLPTFLLKYTNIYIKKEKRNITYCLKARVRLVRIQLSAQKIK